jgi:hypothetical protein
MRQSGDCPAVCVRLMREIGAGAAALIVMGFAAVVLFPAGDLAGRVLVMAVTCGLLAAVFADWRAAAVVAGLAVLAFVGSSRTVPPGRARSRRCPTSRSSGWQRFLASATTG